MIVLPLRKFLLTGDYTQNTGSGAITLRLTPISFHSPARRQSVRTPPHRLAASCRRHTPISRLLLSSFSTVDTWPWPIGQQPFWSPAGHQPPYTGCGTNSKSGTTDNGYSRATRRHQSSAPTLGTNLSHWLVACRGCQSVVSAG